MVIRANLSSDGSEEAEMKAEHQPRLKPKAENVVKKESRVFFSSPPSVPVERDALAEWQNRAEGSLQCFFFPPLTTVCHHRQAALTRQQNQASIKGTRLLAAQPPIRHQNMRNRVI